MGNSDTAYDTLSTQFDERPVRELTMNSALENRAAHLGGAPFIRYGPDDRDVSFAEMNEAANTIGNSLLELDISHQAKISVMMRDPLETLFGMFGIHKAGGVYCPINFEYTGDALSYQLNDTNPEVLLIEDQYVERLNNVLEDLEVDPEIVVHETDANSEPLDPAFSSCPFSSMFEGETEAPDVNLTWDDEASIIYTSGTTGKPKGVVLPHRWIFANYTLIFGQTMNQDDVVHTALPLYHVGGVYADIISALVAGASVGLWDRFSPEEFWTRVEKYEATCVTFISVMWTWLVKQPERDDDHRNTLNKISVIPLPEDHEEVAKRFSFDFVLAGFGQTESGIPVGGFIHAAQGEHGTPDDLLKGMPPEEVIRRSEELGFPVVDTAPGHRYMAKPMEMYMETTILDDRDEELPPGEVGEFAVRPKAPGIIMKEYYGRPEKTVSSWRNLWFHTGDAAYRDEDDNYFFVDRMGDVIRRRGENISSIQIQDAVTAYEPVAQAAVFPVPAEEGGEDAIAVAIETGEGTTISEEELLGYLDGRLPEFMQPDHIMFVDEIPTTETNKREKYKLRERF